jgi:undecaprenyl-diphosphatase
VDRGGFRIAGDRRQVARRAAWRGLAAGSAATNILGKSLTARDRPHDKVPGARQLNRAPRTTSFPSGHAASAAAFATGVALEKPSLAAPVIIAAAAVGASRVVTGMHYPSDVLAGFTIGAAAGALTLRWWPRRPPVPAAAIRPPRGAPAVPRGEDLVLAVNRSAGTTSAKLVRRLRAERLLDRIDAPHLARVRAARAAARERAWEAGAAPERGGELRIDFDATISIAHRTGTERGGHLEEDIRIPPAAGLFGPAGGRGRGGAGRPAAGRQRGQ